jgi:hypothetical protein
MTNSLELPPFANQSVRASFEELRRLEATLDTISDKVLSGEARIERIKKHSDRVSRELHEMQSEVREILSRVYISRPGKLHPGRSISEMN